MPSDAHPTEEIEQVRSQLAELQRVAVGDPEADDESDGEGLQNGLARLVLSLVKLLHDLLEKQAIRRMNAGTLTDDEVERVGRTLQKQYQEIEHLCEVFGLDVDDLDLDLGTVSYVEE